MKILILPLILLLIPILILAILLYFLKRNNIVSKSLKIILGVFFVALSIWATGYATLMSLEGIGEKGIRCATGVLVFPALGFVLTFAAIPLLLIFYRNKSQNIRE